MKKRKCLEARVSGQVVYSKGYNHYFTCKNHIELLSLIQTDKEVNEYIGKDDPVILFFDIEYYTKKSSLRLEEMNRVIGTIIERTNVIFKDMTVRYGLARASNEDKESAHLFIRIFLKTGEEMVFENITVLKKFILAEYIKLSGVDYQVYRQNGGLFRCLNQSKSLDKHKGRVFCIDKNFTSTNFTEIEFFVTYHRPIFNFYQTSIPNNVLQSNSANNIYEPALITGNGTSVIQNQLLKAIGESLMKRSVEPEIQKIINSKNCIEYRIIGLSDICLKHNRAHKSNRQIMSIDPVEFKYNCFDNEVGRLIRCNSNECLKQEQYEVLFDENTIVRKLLHSCKLVDPGILDLIPSDLGFESPVSPLINKDLLKNNDNTAMIEIKDLKHVINFKGHILTNSKDVETKVNNLFINLLNQTNNITNIQINKLIIQNTDSNRSKQVIKGSVDQRLEEIANKYCFEVNLRRWFVMNNLRQLVLYTIKNQYWTDILITNNDRFFKFENGLWFEKSNGIIRSLIGNRLDEKLTEAILNKEDNMNELDKNTIIKRVSMLVSSSSNLSTFCSHLISHCDQPDFLNLLDSNWNLIPFTNGAFDISNNSFRALELKDFVSFNTNYAYNPTVDSQLVFNVLSLIFPDTNELEYVLTIIAKMLNPNTGNDNLVFFTGSGSNGKSILFTLIKASLGMLCDEVGNNFFSPKDSGAQIAQPQLLALKNKRIALLSEPNSTTKFCSSMVKKLCGNEGISARSLYSNKYENYWARTHFIVSSNNIPEFTNQDEAVWRRVSLVCFSQKFVDNPTQTWESQADPELVEKIRRNRNYKEGFIKLLLERINKPLPITPRRFEVAKNSELSSVLNFKYFLKERIIFKKDAITTNNEIIEAYRNSPVYEKNNPSNVLKAQIRLHIETLDPSASIVVKRLKDKLKRGWLNIELTEE